jgi:hypothetical protein
MNILKEFNYLPALFPSVAGKRPTVDIMRRGKR